MKNIKRENKWKSNKAQKSKTNLSRSKMKKKIRFQTKNFQE